MKAWTCFFAISARLTLRIESSDLPIEHHALDDLDPTVVGSLTDDVLQSFVELGNAQGEAWVRTAALAWRAWRQRLVYADPFGGRYRDDAQRRARCVWLGREALNRGRIRI